MARSEHNTTPPAPRALIIPGGLLTVVALAIRLYRLDTQSLWLDEGSTWAEISGRSGKGWLALLAELFSPSAGYPLYHLILKAWIAIAGDSEWALRFPSALAGALAVLAIVAAANEVRVEVTLDENQHRSSLVAAGLLGAISPYALWHAQDAKVYSLLILAAALLVWTFLRALRLETRPAWLCFAMVALVSIFIHRLALLLLAGAAVAAALHRWRGGRAQPLAAPVALLIAVALGLVGIGGTILAARGERPGSSSIVGPIEGLWYTLTRFGLDRWPAELDGYLGIPGLAWLLPFVALTVWGLLLLLRDALAGHRGAPVVLCLAIVPLVLFAMVHTLAPIYESRYAAPAFPAWVLALVYPLLVSGERQKTSRRGEDKKRRGGEGNRAGNTYCASAASLIAHRPSLALMLLALICLASIASLLQPGKGLFSGAPVKEQWREAVAALAVRVHPDDLVLLHPYYVEPLYAYYAPRVTPDPLPHPVTFPIFAEGDTCGIADPTRQQLLECIRRRFEPFFNQQAEGHKRALLLIAPEHARTVDPPPLPQDRFGWVGLRFQYPQRTWPCGGAEFVGVMIMCQSYPETFNASGAGTIPMPDIPLDAIFGSALRLRGYSLALHGNAARPGGTLPVTLYWTAVAAPTRDYRVFLHLCRDCDVPPVANDDGPPLGGYAPAGLTSTWRVGDPLHDERALALPRNLAPGRYTLVMGVYSGDGAPETRLPIAGTTPALTHNRLVLGTVEVAAPAQRAYQPE
ncbi:MAG: glycosyltransferase family 39 protein [Chloroflexi bacterium]|nr:glycosyltransferase family 39 protein [Chloroflexota bacterium]